VLCGAKPQLQFWHKLVALTGQIALTWSENADLKI